MIVETNSEQSYGNTRTGTVVRSQSERSFVVNSTPRVAGERRKAYRCLTSSCERLYDVGMSAQKLTRRQRQVLMFIEQQIRDRGYPPSVREIGEAVGLTSPSTVHSHLRTLQNLGYLRRDPTKPRAIEVRWDPNSGAIMERRPVRHVPLVGDVAAGTDVLAEENVEELYPLPADFIGDGDLFMLRVRGESMVGAGILDGDFVIAEQVKVAGANDIVVAGIPGGEATVKRYRSDGPTITLMPENPVLEPMVFDAADVQLYGKVVAVFRRL